MHCNALIREGLLCWQGGIVLQACLSTASACQTEGGLLATTTSLGCALGAPEETPNFPDWQNQGRITAIAAGACLASGLGCVLGIAGDYANWEIGAGGQLVGLRQGAFFWDDGVDTGGATVLVLVLIQQHHQAY